MVNEKEVILNWLFYLDDIEIEEPVGLADIELSIKRDDKMHGITFEASTSPLQFYGVAYDYLKQQKETYGVKANVTFRALATCDNYDYEEVLSGRLNFGKYKKSCGDQCFISIPWEQDSCEVVLKARYDQKVDMDKTTGVDGITSLSYYNGLGIETELTAHNLKTGTEGYVEDAGDQIDVSIFANYGGDPAVRATYARAIDESLLTSELSPAVFASSDNGLNDPILSPVVLLDESLGDCYDGTFDYEVRLKGSFDITFTGPNGEPSPGTTFFFFKAVAGKGEWNEFPPPDPQTGDWDKGLTVIDSADVNPTVAGDHWTGTFDIPFSGNTIIDTGKGFYAYLVWEALGPVTDIKMVGNITFDKETYVKVQGVRSCPSSNAQLYLVHESLSRATEAITNGCIRVKSSYYGRLDSQPFSFDEDGCGGLRSVTSGLKIRRADEDKFFTSLKDLVEGLNAIDNIGMDVIDDPDIPGRALLRIEEVDFFYQDSEVLRHDAVPSSDAEIEEEKHFSKIQVGYKKWEVENVNGLDEFNSNREYNTSIDTINSTLDITSNLVTGSYAIELTRQQSFATTGAADTKYDNEVLLLSMLRSDYPYTSLNVEKGGITNPENIFSPSTVYNFRLSPLRNLMRWYKTIAPSFVNISDSANKLFFSSGTGNLTAKGMLTDSFCRLEASEIQENQNLFVTQFANSADYQPIWENETIAYDYPMSIADYKKVKANKYGYISMQCGTGEFVKYWIVEIKYRMVKGVATFILRKKYGV